MSTTYRPRSGERWAYFPAVCVLIAVIYFGVPGLFSSSHSNSNSCLQGLFLAAGILVLVIIASWRTSTSRVVVDDAGIDWKGGGVEPGRLRWDEIKGLDYDRNVRILVIGLTEKPSGRFRPLPFITKELYIELKNRVGGAPPEVEGECLLR